MSYWSTAHRRLSSFFAGLAAVPASAAIPAQSLPGPRAGYTLTHAGHQLRIGPIAFWIIVGTLVIMAGWTIVTATYFAFRDDVLTRLISRTADMQFAYEDRIAEMRAQVDRVTSRQLLDQEQFEQKLDQLLRRQAALESRAAMLGGAIGPGTTGSIHRHPDGPGAADRLTSRPKPSPISDTVRFLAPVEREARLESRMLPTSDGRIAADSKAGGIEGALARLQRSLDRVEESQTAALNAMEEHFDVRARRMRNVLADLGVDLTNLPPAKTRGAGGPFIPVKPSSANPFERQLYRLTMARAQLERLTDSLTSVPLRKPIVGDLDLSSGFGVRVDPFLGVPAMHTGDDFRATAGDNVFATAAGVVTMAGWSGGYGRLVEVKHGNGFATRYGHLSDILVHVGQRVHLGQIIGRVGSTGRSTGPHLHYETRVDGDAVDPQKFLRAGVRLGAQS
jgi:murein DD-endopeptidase MepM/ murein hydrolase activator NlpD